MPDTRNDQVVVQAGLISLVAVGDIFAIILVRLYLNSAAEYL